MDEEGEHISTTRARQGTTPHMTRHILVWGTLLVSIIFLILLIAWS